MTHLTDDELERMRQRLAKAVRATVSSKKIRAIRVNSSEHWQPPLYIEVGRTCAHLERDSKPETVLAIFEAPSFMVVTAQRGLTNNLPYFFAKSDVREVIALD